MTRLHSARSKSSGERTLRKDRRSKNVWEGTGRAIIADGVEFL